MRISCEVNLKNVNIPLLLSEIIVSTSNNDCIRLTFEIAKSEYKRGADDEIRAVGQYGIIEGDCNEMPSWLNHLINRQGLITNMPSGYEVPDLSDIEYNEYLGELDGDTDSGDAYLQIYGDPDDIELLYEAYVDAVKDYEKFVKGCFISSVTFDLDKDECFESAIDIVDVSKLDLSDVKVADARISLGSFEFNANITKNTKVYLN